MATKIKAGIKLMYDNESPYDEYLSQFTELMNKLYAYSRIFHRYEAIPRHYNTKKKLYMNEMHTLQKVFENEGITTGEIATMEQVTQGAVSQKLIKLEAKGFIKKKRNPIEYKKINLYTTESGKIACEFHKQLDASKYTNLMQVVQMEYSDENQQMLNKFIEIIDTISVGMQNDIKIDKLKK